MNKKEIIKILNKISKLLKIKGENFYKIRAYERGARALESMDIKLEKAIEEDSLDEVKSIGKALKEKITTLYKTGTLDFYEELKASFPEGFLELLKVPGLGPKKLKVIWEELGIENLEQLEDACIENRISKLSGFGKKTQDNILLGIDHVKNFQGKYNFHKALKIAQQIVDNMKDMDEISKIEIAGSLRRKKEIVKDIDIIVASENFEKVTDRFLEVSSPKDIIGKGKTKVSINMENGIEIDLRIVNDREFPHALQHFTGSKEHNVSLRHEAKKLGYKINEYGLYTEEKKEPEYCENEKEIYNKINLNFIPPELREGYGEIDLAKEEKLPEQIRYSDIKGLIHVHSDYSDGLTSLQEMIEEAEKRGFEYIGITDHSQSSYYAGGLEPNRLLKQMEVIDKLNKKHKIKILKGVEVDIRSDGSLDYKKEILEKLDFTIASVHQNFKMKKEDMTERIVNAISNPYTSMLGHPTGRLLLSRKGYSIDHERIIEEAAKNKVIIEINANPYRLDLDWRYLKYAKENGVKISINPDAHSIEDIENIKYGVNIANKGALSKKDIVNTLSYEKFIGFINEV